MTEIIKNKNKYWGNIIIMKYKITRKVEENAVYCLFFSHKYFKIIYSFFLFFFTNPLQPPTLSASF